MRTREVLASAGVRNGDEVVIPAYDSIALAEDVVQAGAVPVYADIDRDTYCLSPAAVEAALTPRTAAVVAVHRFGHPADLRGLAALTERHHLLLHDVEEPGTDLTDVERRQEHAAHLTARLRGVLSPRHTPGHSYQQYVVRVEGNGRPDRDAFARALRDRGVSCTVPFRAPVYRMRGFRRDMLLPETERAVDETLALPLHPRMTRRELQRTAHACNALGGLLRPAF
ncbi:DegT/DnrJ/EryC1/StrS family aminotransferase [Streptomyces sp. NPDC059740]|uniref:DegT/DnrJ/EryC1/StrS family aminotransferase n=1 Tax=Streptomyces sp. NPDC059740 TaxID=3346926 RepID=UPI00364FF647